MSEIGNLPAPLIPAGVDLRDFPFTPMFRARLFGSEFHANATDAEWRAGVTLWLKSWDQVPAGTLPVDDVALCRLAELGRDLRAWRKVKDRALHGWHECSDNRLHHPVVAEGVLEAWTKRRTAVTRGKAGAAARYSGRSASASRASTASANGASNAPAIEQASANYGNRQGQGRDREVPSPNGDGRRAAVPPDDPWKAVYDRGKEVLGPSSGGLITKLRKLCEDKPRKVMARIEDAAERRNPLEYLTASLWNADDQGKLAGEYVGGVPP